MLHHWDVHHRTPQGEYGESFAALPEGPDAAVIRNVRCLTSRDIQTAVRRFLPGELAKHAVSEGTKAVTKFYSSTQDTPRSRRAGLQFDIEGVAALASLACKGVLMSEAAVTYLAAVLEYMTAELLELSGNSARDHHKTTISPRHVALALWNDEELNKLNRTVVIRDSGVLPNIDKTLQRISRDNLEPDLNQDEKATSSSAGAAERQRPLTFERVFMDMLKAAPGQILIDPRDGCHKGLVKAAEETICALPALDAACASNVLSRQLKALEALTGDQRKAFNRGVHPRNEDIVGEVCGDDCVMPAAKTAEREAHVAHVGAAYRLRIQAVRDAQKSTMLMLDCEVFERLTREIAQDYRTDLDFTREAVLALQSACEGHMVRLFQDANMSAIHTGRIAIQPKDLQVA